MKTYHVIFLLLLTSLSAMCQQNGFKETQLTYSRVRTAFSEKQENIEKRFEVIAVSGSFELFIRVFKKEGIVEAWVKENTQDNYQLFKQYEICNRKPLSTIMGNKPNENLVSGKLGPKRKEGDRQIPEGFYYITNFNPSSNFYLSLQINYPNTSDKILSDKDKPGNLIFIHGNCVSVGCVPVGDENIKELYALAVLAKDYGQQQIPVHLFPMKLNEKGINYIQTTYAGDTDLIEFWNTLKPGYIYFEEKKQIPAIEVDRNSGKYFIR